MQQDAHANATSFVDEAASVAAAAEQLAARLQQPFTGLNELQDGPVLRLLRPAAK